MRKKELENLLNEFDAHAQKGEEIRKTLHRLLSENNFDEKRTTSYQLGQLLIQSTRSAKALFFLPVSLFRLYGQYRKKKNSPEPEQEQRQEQVLDIAQLQTARKIVVNDLITHEDGFNKGLTLLDPISELCWADTFKGFPLVRAKFEQQIKTSTSQFAFFESAWRANKGTWLYAFTSPNFKHANAQALLRVIYLLKEKGIPLIFWNKEDPMHYEMFKPIAACADYIFTTDALIVDKYKKELQNPNVHALEFAAPVKKTNPLHRFSFNTESVCFAGTYYAKNHENRKKQMDMLLPVLLENEGCIYDRASNENGENYAYPEQYRGILRPAVDFEEMVDLYKKFKVFLNVNTVTQSPTMMSRRVYELLASGTPVVSTPSKAITEQFPGIVITVNSEQEARIAVKKLLTDSYYWHKQSMLGVRKIMSNHTYEQRWCKIQSIVLKKTIEPKLPKVHIISCYDGNVDLALHLKSLIEQKNIEVTAVSLLVPAGLAIDDAIIKNYNVNVIDSSEFSFENYVNEVDPDGYTFITNDKAYNYKYSVWGMCLAYQYSDAAAVTRSSYYKSSQISANFDFSIENPNWYEFMAEASSSCLLIKNNCLTEVAFNSSADKVMWMGQEDKILMIDPFNLVVLDKADISANLENLQGFIYKTSPYLGV